MMCPGCQAPSLKALKEVELSDMTVRNVACPSCGATFETREVVTAKLSAKLTPSTAPMLSLVPFATRAVVKKPRKRGASLEYPPEFMAFWSPIFAMKDERSTPGAKLEAFEAWDEAGRPTDRVLKAWTHYVGKTPKGQSTRHFCRFLSKGLYAEQLESMTANAPPPKLTWDSARPEGDMDAMHDAALARIRAGKP